MCARNVRVCVFVYMNACACRPLCLCNACVVYAWRSCEDVSVSTKVCLMII